MKTVYGIEVELCMSVGRVFQKHSVLKFLQCSGKL